MSGSEPPKVEPSRRQRGFRPNRQTRVESTAQGGAQVLMTDGWMGSGDGALEGYGWMWMWMWTPMVCFALLRFALPARDVFARDAPKTHQYLVHSRLRGGGKPSASSSLTWTLQQRACSSSVAFQSQCLRDRSRYWFWHCRSRAERLPLALTQASQSNACAAVQLLAAHSACTSIVCCDSLDSWAAYQVALLCLASDPLFGHRYCICSQSPNQIFDQVHTSGRHLQVLRVHSMAQASQRASPVRPDSLNFVLEKKRAVARAVR